MLYDVGRVLESVDITFIAQEGTGTLMAYTMASFTAVGFDLARLRNGKVVADVVDTALALNMDLAHHLAQNHPGVLRIERSEKFKAWNVELDVPAREIPTAIHVDSAGWPQDQDSALAMLQSLQKSPMGDLASLENLIRHDILAWSWENVGGISVQNPIVAKAADVLVDAALAGFVAHRLSDDEYQELHQPYVRTTRAWRSKLGYTPRVHLPRNLVEVVRDFVQQSLVQRDKWRNLSRADLPHSHEWSASVNEACWAVYVTDRTHISAAAQLAAVRAFRSCGLGSQEVVSGAWNALSGVIQGLVVADVLAAEHQDVLLEPWRHVFGTNPPFQP